MENPIDLPFLAREEWRIFINVLIASVLTMVVGIEREKADKAAGMRTNMIVGGFTCLIVSLCDVLVKQVAEGGLAQQIMSDPIRIFEAIVVGVSFLGAGTILKSGDQSRVTGITTAATLLYSSGIGVSVALGYYLLAILLAVFVLLINFFTKWVVIKLSSLKHKEE